MTLDLTCLVLNAIWGFALAMLEITGKTRVAGTAWNMGNRDKEPAFPEWIVRTGRALSNHKENFPLFLTAVVVVHLAHRNDRVSGIAALVYVLARAAHGLLFIGGVKGARSLAHGVSLGATFVILSRLL
jgi:uncharacterized MAPEG superfamily protein